MSLASDVAAFKITTDLVITTLEDPNTISPAEVGGQINALADLLAEYGESDITPHIEDVAPTDLDGSDRDWWFYNTGSVVNLYKKTNGSWDLIGALSIGVSFPDGPLTNLRTSIAGDIVTVTPGSWAISNTIYQKATQTQFTLAAADLNFYRYDLIYANTSNQVLILTGTAASTPVQPTLPANCIKIDMAIVPPSSSGLAPYLESGGVNSVGGDRILEISGSPIDVNGEIDLSAYTELPVYLRYTAYNTVSGTERQANTLFSPGSRVMSGFDTTSTSIKIVY